jgi:hypothetical protein
MRASAVAGEERWAASIIVMKRPIESFFIIDSQSFKELASPIPAPVHEYIPKSGLRWYSCDTATSDPEGSEIFEMHIDLLPRV